MTLERPMFPPVDPTRRRFLSVAAGGATALTLAPARAAAPAPDPIFRIIERHQAACADHHEAVRVEFAFYGFDMQGERLRQYGALQEQTTDAYYRLHDAGVDLVNTPPTTLAGIAALCRYIEPLLNDVETVDLPETITWHDDTYSTAAAALANAIAVAIGEISKGGMV